MQLNPMRAGRSMGEGRIKAKLPVEMRCAGKTQVRTATDEISLCGCYIETMFTLDIGTKVELLLSLNQETVIAEAVVATKTPQVGNGIDFVEMDADNRLKLSEYIAECERQAKV